MKQNYIEINKVAKIYKNGFNALKDINLKIVEGEIFALLGPNGAGKSTLINVLCGLTHHTNGQIFINGLNLKENNFLSFAEIAVKTEHNDFLIENKKKNIN